MELNKAIKTLQLKDGTFDQVGLKRQYIQLAKKFHPDSNKDSTKEMFQMISEAY